MPSLDLTAIIVATITGVLALAAAVFAAKTGKAAGKGAVVEPVPAAGSPCTRRDFRGFCEEVHDRLDRLERMVRHSRCQFTDSALNDTPLPIRGEPRVVPPETDYRMRIDREPGS